MFVEFELNGQKFSALNDGPQFNFNEAVSILYWFVPDGSGKSASHQRAYRYSSNNFRSPNIRCSSRADSARQS
jgi:hypothetical protein